MNGRDYQILKVNKQKKCLSKNYLIPDVIRKCIKSSTKEQHHLLTNPIKPMGPFDEIDLD